MDEAQIFRENLLREMRDQEMNAAGLSRAADSHPRRDLLKM